MSQKTLTGHAWRVPLPSGRVDGYLPSLNARKPRADCLIRKWLWCAPGCVSRWTCPFPRPRWKPRPTWVLGRRDGHQSAHPAAFEAALRAERRGRSAQWRERAQKRLEEDVVTWSRNDRTRGALSSPLRAAFRNITRPRLPCLDPSARLGADGTYVGGFGFTGSPELRTGMNRQLSVSTWSMLLLSGSNSARKARHQVFTAREWNGSVSLPSRGHPPAASGVFRVLTCLQVCRCVRFSPFAAR